MSEPYEIDIALLADPVGINTVCPICRTRIHTGKYAIGITLENKDGALAFLLGREFTHCGKVAIGPKTFDQESEVFLEEDRLKEHIDRTGSTAGLVLMFLTPPVDRN